MKEIIEIRHNCATDGHIKTLVIADNGFTYERICGHCGVKL